MDTSYKKTIKIVLKIILVLSSIIFLYSGYNIFINGDRTVFQKKIQHQTNLTYSMKNVLVDTKDFFLKYSPEKNFHFEVKLLSSEIEESGFFTYSVYFFASNTEKLIFNAKYSVNIKVVEDEKKRIIISKNVMPNNESVLKTNFFNIDEGMIFDIKIVFDVNQGKFIPFEFMIKKSKYSLLNYFIISSLIIIIISFIFMTKLLGVSS